jgi:glycosyltransferase involved in cell wall biosynthesis
MKVLVSAYICAPNRGSEPGAGWNWSLAAAEEHDVWVITRATNRTAIEAELATHPHPRMHFVYVELPPWGLRLKKGERGIRYFSYYTLWQFAALRTARKLHAKLGFDLVHHVTFANMWLPALVGFVGAPFVLGPVGGGTRVPPRHYAELGAVGAARETARVVLQGASRLNPLTRASWNRATLIVVQNHATRSAFPRRHRSRIVVRPNTSLPKAPNPARTDKSGSKPLAILAGRLVPWKGGSLAIRAVARTPDWSLMVIGSGPDRERLGSLAAELGLEDRVTFVPWVAQHDLWDAMAQADALLLPSLRDDAPFVVGEAQGLGLPVVAFDQGGPRECARFAGSTVLTVPLRGSDPAGALADGLRRAALVTRAESGAAYGIPTISQFLDTAYGTASGAGKRC